MSMFRLAQVTKVYASGKAGSHAAVEDVSLNLTRHQTTVFAGPSGSGKTTLLSLVGCMVRPTAGRIFFDNKEVTSLPERFLVDIRRRRVGFIFQNYHLIKGISVLENVIMPVLPLGRPMPPLQRRAQALLEQMGIAHLYARPVQHLSGGEQQRVAIARALINEPEMIIADEPTAHLDTSRSKQFMALIAELKDQGRTVLMASHDPLVCSHAAVDRVVTLEDGRIREDK